MALIQTIDRSLFVAAFERYNRVGAAGNFSYSALYILFDYLEGLSEDIGEDIKLDVITLCCDYEEVSLEDFANEYKACNLTDFDGNPLSLENDEEEIMDRIKDYLYNNTSFVGFTDCETVVFAVF